MKMFLKSNQRSI